MPTLAQVRTLLSRYAGAGNDFTDRLNLIRARLLEDGSWPGMTPRIPLPVYTDADGFAIVTLPRQYLAILRGQIQNSSWPLCLSPPMGTSGVFNESNGYYCGYGGSSGSFDLNFQEVPDYFCVFREWTSPAKIRLKFEQSETAGTIYLSGTNAGADVWATNSAVWERREGVAFTGNTTVTSANKFDAKGFGLLKPATKGRVSAYAVDDDGTETLIGVYQPDETRPRWRRYRISCVCSGDSCYTYVAIVRIGYVPVSNDSDEVIPGNIGALQYGFDALLEQDARSYDKAEAAWEMARARLVRQSEAESEGTMDHVEITDDFNFAALGRGL